MKELAKAVISVMMAVKGIDKSMTVGSGSNSYKGVPDKEVKKAYNEAMSQNGLCILPLDIEAKTVVSRWDEVTNYNGVAQTKSKQSVFTEVTTKYLLLHSSGESQIISGYGQGIDAQDKGAGKATTYALKYALLYTFLTPTGTIDDTDNTHNEEQETPPPPAAPLPPPPPAKSPQKPKVNLIPGTPQWTEAIKFLKGDGTIEQIKKKYILSTDHEENLKLSALESA